MNDKRAFSDIKLELKPVLENIIQHQEVKEWLNQYDEYHSAPDSRYGSEELIRWVSKQEFILGQLYFNEDIRKSIGIECLISILNSIEQIDFSSRINFGTGITYPLRVELFTLWLVHTAIKHNVDQAINILEAYIESNAYELKHKSIYIGIHVNDAIELDENLWLLPYSEAPDSTLLTYYPKSQNQISHIKMKTSGPISPTRDISAVALVSSYTVKPMFLKSHNSDDSYQGYKRMLYMSVHAVGDLLTLFSEHGIFHLASCACYSDAALMAKEAGVHKSFTFSGYQLSDITPHIRTSPLKNTQLNELKVLYESYKKLKSSDRNKLQIIIRRLARAMPEEFSAFNREDRAIDIGIAFESLLLPETKEGELSYRLALRGALLGGDTVNERSKIRTLLKNVYNYRSQAVHNGVLTEQTKNKKVIRTLQEVDQDLRDAISLCIKLIKKVIITGHLPDYKQLEIGSTDEDTISEFNTELVVLDN